MWNRNHWNRGVHLHPVFINLFSLIWPKAEYKNLVKYKNLVQCKNLAKQRNSGMNWIIEKLPKSWQCETCQPFAKIALKCDHWTAKFYRLLDGKWKTWKQTFIGNKYYESAQVYFEKNQTLKYSVLGWDVSEHLIVELSDFLHIDKLNYWLSAIMKKVRTANAAFSLA